MQSNAERLHLEPEPYLRSAAAVMQTSNSLALAADLWDTMTPRAKEAIAQQQVFRRHEYGRTASPSVSRTMLTMSKLGSIKRDASGFRAGAVPARAFGVGLNAPAIAQPFHCKIGPPLLLALRC